MSDVSDGYNEDYGPGTYGETIAEVYDDWYDDLDTEGAVELLAALGGAGPVLELAIGTGRLALPLSERGLEVHGIDASRAMVERLQAKPGGEDITVTIGDFADVNVDGRFPLVFVAFNTFFGLLTQEEQIRCFRNVADHLSADGLFLIEAFVPDLSRFDRGQRLGVEQLGPDGIVLEASRHDPVNQRSDTQHVVISQEGVAFYPVRVRYAWPAELDLMARLAGLRLRERWGGWRREPFTASSETHISVYEATAD